VDNFKKNYSETKKTSHKRGQVVRIQMESLVPTLYKLTNAEVVKKRYISMAT
jgi:hypothetical protein